MFGKWGGFGMFGMSIKSPIIGFIYAILAKTITISFIGVVMVTYWVLKGLHDNGMLAKMQDAMVESLETTKAVAQHCTPKLTNLDQFLRCLDNPPKYRATREEAELVKAAEAIQKLTLQQMTEQNEAQYFEDSNHDPYTFVKPLKITPDRTQ